MNRKAPIWSLAVLFGVNLLNFYDRQVLGALAEPVRKEFRLSDTQLGAITTIFTLLYAVVGLPLGRLADQASRKKLLAAGVAVWATLTATSGMVTSYAMLLVSRLGVATGEAVCAPTATSWIGDLFPPAQRSRALAVFMMAVPIGSALTFSVSGMVAQVWGWRAAMVLAGVPAILLIPVLLSLPEPRRGATEAHAPGPKAGSPWVVLRIPTLWWIIASGALVNFNLYVIGTFLPAFMTRYHGLSIAHSGVLTGLGHGVAGVTGAAIAGVLGDRVIRKRKNGRLLAASAAALLATPMSFFSIQQPAGSAYSAILFLMAAYGLLNMYYGLVYSAIHDIVAPALRGTTMAIYFMAMYLCGASFGPVLTGKLSDLMARSAAEAAGSPVVTEAARAIGLHQAMYVIPILCAALGIVLYAGSRTISADMERRVCG